MKVFKTILAVAVAAFMFASCEKEQYNTTLNKTEVINYSVVLDDVTGTRASELYDGSKINRLDYVVYMLNEDGTTYTATEVKEIGKEFTGSQTVVSIELIKGQSYKITFIAYTDTQKGNWWSTADNQVITFDHSKVSANSDSGDLFVACVDHQTTSVSLKRPLALVNLMLSQAHVETANKLGFNPANAQITYTVSNIAKSYDLLNGTVSGTDSCSLTNSFGDVANSYYTMSSVLVAAGQTVNCNIAKVTCTGLNEITLNKAITSIPAKANYKTNVKIGSLLTNKFDYNLTVSAGFDTPDEEKLVD